MGENPPMGRGLTDGEKGLLALFALLLALGGYLSVDRLFPRA